jgi:hypothetical protein
MGWIPGWDSIEGAGWWSTFYFWAGIVSLLSLGVCEVISHRYTARKDELTEIVQIATQRRHDEDMARVQYDSALANERAAEANKRAAEANQKAQDASLELAKFKAPRVLPQEQRDRIVDKLKQFSGTEYDITISDADPEILSLVRAIELVLSAAGWSELDWKGTGEALIRDGKQPLIRLGASVTNVFIGAHTDQPPKLFDSALALSDALQSEGIDATAATLTPHQMSSTNANAVHILVGRKQ